MKIIINQNIGCLMTFEGLLFHSEGLAILVYRNNLTCFVIISLENYLLKFFNFVIPSITS